jgi:hypothetical protein
MKNYLSIFGLLLVGCAMDARTVAGEREGLDGAEPPLNDQDDTRTDVGGLEDSKVRLVDSGRDAESQDVGTEAQALGKDSAAADPDADVRVDAEVPEAGVDAAVTDAGQDSGPVDAGGDAATDTGLADSGTSDAEPAESGAQDTGPAEDSAVVPDAAQDSSTPPTCEPLTCAKISSASDLNPTQQQIQSDLDIVGQDCDGDAGLYWQTNTVCSNVQYCQDATCLPCDAREVDRFTTVELYKGKINYEKMIDCQGCHCQGRWWYTRLAECPDLTVVRAEFSSPIHGIVVTISGSSFSASVLPAYNTYTKINYSELTSITRSSAVKAVIKITGSWEESPGAGFKPYELNARLVFYCNN